MEKQFVIKLEPLIVLLDADAMQLAIDAAVNA
jgi:hypothetical protein